MSNNIDDEYGGLSPDQLTELQNYAGLPVHQQQQNQSYPPISHTDSAGKLNSGLAKKAQTGAQPVYGGNTTTDVEYGSLPDLVVQQLQTQSISQVQANNPYGKLPLAQRGSGPVLPILAPAQPPPQTGPNNAYVSIPNITSNPVPANYVGLHNVSQPSPSSPYSAIPSLPNSAQAAPSSSLNYAAQPYIAKLPVTKPQQSPTQKESPYGVPVPAVHGNTAASPPTQRFPPPTSTPPQQFQNQYPPPSSNPPNQNQYPPPSFPRAPPTGSQIKLSSFNSQSTIQKSQPQEGGETDYGSMPAPDSGSDYGHMPLNRNKPQPQQQNQYQAFPSHQ